MQLSARDLLFVRHTYDRSRQVFPTATGGIAATSFTQFWTDSTSGNQFFTAEENRTLSPSLLNSARFSTSVLTYQQQPANTLSQPLAFIQGAPFMGAIQVGGLSQLGNDFTTPSVDDITYLTWTDDLTYSKGKHLLKTGMLIEHAFSSKQTTTNSRGAYSFASLTTFLAGTARQFQGVLPGAVLVRERPKTTSMCEGSGCWVGVGQAIARADPEESLDRPRLGAAAGGRAHARVHATGA